MGKTEQPMDEYIKLLTDHQLDLRAFIMSSLGDHADTQDVLQLTNVVLWKKAETFQHGAPFLPWAFQIARYEILTFMRKQRRDRHVFSPEVVELMIDIATERATKPSMRGDALRECIKSLPERSRELLQIRYAQEQSVKQVAEKTGRSIQAVKSVYLRIRRALEECIERKLMRESGAS